MKTETIRQTATLPAPPKAVYELLMDSRKHAALIGGKATVSRKVMGKFKVFDGYCNGYNIELVEGKKIVQAWNFAEDGWPGDHYSVCTFVLKKSAGGTTLAFTQRGVPERNVGALKNGWKQFYWQPMKARLAKK